MGTKPYVDVHEMCPTVPLFYDYLRTAVLVTSAVLRLECSLDCLSAPTLWRYDVTETYSHVVRQNLQKRKLRVLNPARIHVFYWFNWLNLIGS